ncbi:MAG: PTS sugar transporter subunit IIA [Lacrimispora sp.]|uniref:PTS sugar transporter subunit IIA n=1 Tax=Lacrimispora sp. TaxID=2719234 RepID=UPI0039E71391
MLKEMLKNKITVMNQAGGWQEAIRIAAVPLLEEEFIQGEYVNAMINSVQENGPYIVILPQIAIPHARPENGVLKTGLSMLKLSDSVVFPGSIEVRLLIILAAKDSDRHMELISELAEVLMEDDIVNGILAAKVPEEIMELL